MPVVICDVIEFLAPFSNGLGSNAKEAFRFDLTGGKPGGKVLYTSVPLGIPRGQASLRLCLEDKDLLHKTRFTPDPGFMDLVTLFIALLKREDPGAEDFAYQDPEGWVKIFVGQSVPTALVDHEPTNITGPEGAALMTQFGRHYAACRHFYGRMGYLGYGSDGLQRGDRVVVLPNCKVPLILRKVGECYKFVSTCFVLGLMDGEAGRMVDRGETLLQELHVR